MYGTVARMKIKPGTEAQIQEFSRKVDENVPSGFVFRHVYRLDADPESFLMVVAFASKDAYVANATSPEQAARYQQFRDLLTADPEWHDGEIVDSRTAG